VTLGLPSAASVAFPLPCRCSDLNCAQFIKKPVKVVVTGAAGNIAYAILFMVRRRVQQHEDWQEAL
jgi:hypothetical protein